ncbi:MAG: winged helix-turn-helix domain-containing protein [Candidatus Thermoplasmatota archaeon]
MEGFIISDKVRKAIFLEIASGENSITRIAKKNRIIESVAKNALKELIEKGIIEEKNGEYKLSEEGAKLYGRLKGKNLIE